MSAIAFDCSRYSYSISPKIKETVKQKIPLDATIEALFQKKSALAAPTAAFTPERFRELKRHIQFIDALSDHTAAKYRATYFFIASLIIWVAKKLNLGGFGKLQALRDTFEERIATEAAHLGSYLVAEEAIELVDSIKGSRKKEHYFPLKNRKIIAITLVKVVETALYYSTVAKTCRLVARISAAATATTGAKESILREYSFFQKLKKKEGIWPILQAIEDPITLYQELAEGTFSQLAPTLSRTECKEYIKKLLQALVAMDEAHILHFDIKGSNILLTPSQKKVGFSDFGHAEELHSERLEKRLKSFFSYGKYGTTCYTPPELLGVQGLTPDQNLDLFPFGIVLYKLFVSKTLPWITHIPEKIQELDARGQAGYRAAIQQEADRLLAFSSNSMEAFIGSLLQSDPKNRFSAQEALDAFQNVL